MTISEDEIHAQRIARAELGNLLVENARLQAQVQELQAHSTAMVNAQLSRQVRAFHEKYDHPTRNTPCVPTSDEVRFRLSLIAEEFFELLAACEIWPTLDGDQTHEEVLACDIIRLAIQDDFAGQVDLPEFVDAMADLSYVIEGTAAALGVNMTPIVAEVQRANMSKVPQGAQVKPLKPNDWQSPDIAGVLIKQGWRK